MHGVSTCSIVGVRFAMAGTAPWRPGGSDFFGLGGGAEQPQQQTSQPFAATGNGPGAQEPSASGSQQQEAAKTGEHASVTAQCAGGLPQLCCAYWGHLHQGSMLFCRLKCGEQ